MKQKILFFLLLLFIDLIVITFVLRQDLADKDFSLVVLFLYAVIANFILAGIISRTNKASYSGLFIMNAVVMPLLMYWYT